MKIKELYTDESKWCRGEYARDKYGKETKIESSNACQWCAIRKCYSYPENLLIKELVRG